MCGIIGYMGEKPLGEILLEGLRGLEYRGYDSAGVAVCTDSRIITVKREGNLDRLEEALHQKELSGTCGIGHTRWATHGKPSEINAHPHLDCGKRIALVHNGIIENFSELKERLLARGHRFTSETDSEVLVHLIEEELTGSDLMEAVRRALQDVRGSYAIVCVSLEHPGTMVGARWDSPLLVGVGKGETFLASALPAFLRHTKRAMVLGNGDVVSIQGDRIEVINLQGVKQSRKVVELDYDIDAAEKGGYEDFMLKEIFEQPEAWSNTLRGNHYQRGKGFPSDFLPLEPKFLQELERIIFVACGTAFHAALLARYVFEQWMDISVEVDIASEFRYREPKLDSRTLVVAVSQSGETADTMAALRGALEREACTVAIVNTVGSQMTQEAHAVIYTHAGPEIGVAATKTFISQIAAVYLLGLYLGEKTGSLHPSFVARTHGQLEAMQSSITEVLEGHELVRECAGNYWQCEDFLFLGRNINYPVAMEGALKLKEISYIHAEGYPAGEMKHGPIALLHPRFPVVAIAPQDQVYEKMISNLEEIKARSAPIIAVATKGDKEIRKHCEQVIYVPVVEPILSPAVVTPVLQLLAYYIAKMRGCNVDQPRNLAKTVTVE
jgi:glucosamine--fructose-6-phosphate aminotransferase (isomerizing)